MNRIVPIILSWFFALILVGCAGGDEDLRPIATEILGEDVFRNVRLGDSIQSVQSSSNHQTLRHDDFLGLSFVDSVADFRILSEYLNGKIGTEYAGQVVSIVANAESQNEIRATKLYSEMEEILEGKYGIPEGVFGNRTWESAVPPNNREGDLLMDIELKLLKSEQMVSLNFVLSESMISQ